MVTFEPTLFTALAALYLTSLASASTIPVAGRYDNVHAYNGNSNVNSNINNNQNENYFNDNYENDPGSPRPTPKLSIPVIPQPPLSQLSPFDDYYDDNSNSNSNFNNNQNTNINSNYNDNHENDDYHPPGGVKSDMRGTVRSLHSSEKEEDSQNFKKRNLKYMRAIDIAYRPRRTYEYRGYSRPYYFETPPVTTATVAEPEEERGRLVRKRDDHHDQAYEGSFERGRQLQRRSANQSDSPDTSPESSPSHIQARGIYRRKKEEEQDDHHHNKRCCLRWDKCRDGRPGEKYAYGRRYCCYKYGKCPKGDGDEKEGN